MVADSARQRDLVRQQAPQEEADLLLVPQRIVDSRADVVRHVVHHRDERAVAVAQVLEQAQRAVLRARAQQLTIGRRERLESLRQQLRREVDAQQAAARFAPSARREHMAGIEHEKHFLFQLERVVVDAQRITAIPCCMNGRQRRR